jgi:hypothetical protein
MRPTARAILSWPLGPVPRPVPRAIRSAQFGQCRLGGLQQILALAGPLLGQQRVLADDQPLAGKLG